MPSAVGRESGEVGECVICMEAIKVPKRLPCSHVFCEECINDQFKYKKVCPSCGQVCGIITGISYFLILYIYHSLNKRNTNLKEVQEKLIFRSLSQLLLSISFTSFAKL